MCTVASIPPLGQRKNSTILLDTHKHVKTSIPHFRACSHINSFLNLNLSIKHLPSAVSDDTKSSDLRGLGQAKGTSMGRFQSSDVP